MARRPCANVLTVGESPLGVARFGLRRGLGLLLPCAPCEDGVKRCLERKRMAPPSEQPEFFLWGSFFWLGLSYINKALDTALDSMSL